MVVSSAPSSAYYSDLSVTAIPSGGANNERAYEIVGLTVMSQPLPNWDTGGGGSGSGGGAGGGGGTSMAAGVVGTAGGTSTAIGSNNEGIMSQRRTPRLAAINETSTTTVPSDYV